MSRDAIRDLVDRQGDKPAYCDTLARVVDSGAYDIDQRADLREPLKRIFGEGIGPGAGRESQPCTNEALTRRGPVAMCSASPNTQAE